MMDVLWPAVALAACAMTYHLVLRWLQQRDAERVSVDRHQAWERELSELQTKFALMSDQMAVVAQRSEGSIVSMTAFINEARGEIERIKQKETLALAGLNIAGKKGLRQAP